VSDTTYILAALIVRANGSIQPGLPTVSAGDRLHHFVNHPAKEQGIGLFEIPDRVTMQVFVAGIAR
jgi:hypothetical protein